MVRVARIQIQGSQIASELGAREVAHARLEREVWRAVRREPTRDQRDRCFVCLFHSTRTAIAAHWTVMGQ